MIDKINLSPSENKLYEIIWRQTLASQMSSAKIKTNFIQIEIDNNKDYYFESNVENIIF